MTVIKAVFLDPAFANLGIAKAHIDLGKMQIEPIELHLLSTSNESGKKVRKSSDDLRRAREQAKALQELEGWADLFIAEIPSGSQSARASLGSGVSIGLLASIRKPLIEISPAEAKKAVIGRATATKDEMINWAYAKYPELNWIKKGNSKRPNKLTDANEHLADALAIGQAGISTPEFKAAASMMAAINRSN